MFAAWIHKQNTNQQIFSVLNGAIFYLEIIEKAAFHRFNMFASGFSLKEPGSFNSPCICKTVGRYDSIWQCHCYEEIRQCDWKWRREGIVALFSRGNRDAIFHHPFYRAGTGLVRGDTPLQKNLHYFWEIKILSNLYGTDMVSMQIYFYLAFFQGNFKSRPHI